MPPAGSQSSTPAYQPSPPVSYLTPEEEQLLAQQEMELAAQEQAAPTQQAAPTHSIPGSTYVPPAAYQAAPPPAAAPAPASESYGGPNPTPVLAAYSNPDYVATTYPASGAPVQDVRAISTGQSAQADLRPRDTSLYYVPHPSPPRPRGLGEGEVIPASYTSAGDIRHLPGQYVARPVAGPFDAVGSLASQAGQALGLWPRDASAEELLPDIDTSGYRQKGAIGGGGSSGRGISKGGGASSGTAARGAVATGAGRGRGGPRRGVEKSGAPSAPAAPVAIGQTAAPPAGGKAIGRGVSPTNPTSTYHAVPPPSASARGTGAHVPKSAAAPSRSPVWADRHPILTRVLEQGVAPPLQWTADAALKAGNAAKWGAIIGVPSLMAVSMAIDGIERAGHDLVDWYTPSLDPNALPSEEERRRMRERLASAGEAAVTDPGMPGTERGTPTGGPTAPASSLASPTTKAAEDAALVELLAAHAAPAGTTAPIPGAINAPPAAALPAPPVPTRGQSAREAAPTSDDADTLFASLLGDDLRLEDFLHDFDGDGTIGRTDRTRAQSMLDAARKRRGRKHPSRSRKTIVPQFPESPSRTRILDDLDAALPGGVPVRRGRS